MNQKYKSLLSNTLVFAIGSFGSKLITFLLVPLYTNILTAAEYGTADLVTTCSNIFVPIFSLVVQDSVLRFGIDRNKDSNVVVKNALIVLVIGSVAFTFLTPFLGFYKTISEWKWYLLSITISTMFSNVLLCYVKALGRNKLYSIISIVNALVLAITNFILLAVFHTGVRGYLLANIIAQMVNVTIIVFATKIYRNIFKTKFNAPLMSEMLKYCIPLIFNNLSWWVLNSSDRIMVEGFCSAEGLGLYSAASKIPALLSIITSIFSQAWTLSAVQEYDNEKEKSFYSNIFEIYSLIMFIGGSIVIFIAKDFMKVYVGKEFYQAWTYVPLLVLGAVYFAFSAFFGAIYSASKKNIGVACTTGIAAVINVAINVLLLPRIGVIGAAVSTAVSYFSIAIIRMIHSRKYFCFKINYVKFCVCSIILLLQTLLVTINWNNYLVSLLTIFSLIVTNINTVKRIRNILEFFTKKRRGL